MNRLALWLMTGVSGWLAFKSLRAQDEAALQATGHGGRIQHAEGRDRGRTAGRPGEIPAPGWKDILVRTYRSLSGDRVMQEAAGVTYYVLMALFPGLAALVAIYGLIANPADIERQLAGLSGTIPQEAITIIQGQLEHLASQNRTALSFAFFGSLLVSLWSANAAIKALFSSLNVVYGETERRNFFKLNALSLAVTLGMILFLVLAMIGIVVVPAVLNLLQLGGAGALIINILRWPALLVIVILGLALLYRYGPNRQAARWRWITWGSVVAAILWLVASMLFSWYTVNFGNYNKTYGSLGAIVILLLWFYIAAFAVLLGAELNAEMELYTDQDTTSGDPAPLGERGAYVADHVR